MRERLRKDVFYDARAVRDNFIWPDHVLRLLATAAAVAWIGPDVVMDPACGDASIIEHAHKLRPIRSAMLGDISGPQIAALRTSFPHEDLVGDALETMATFGGVVDMVVLTEILEHVEDPDAILAAARARGKYLVASSPINETVGIGNHEHVWAWDQSGYEQMLRDADWTPMAYQQIAFPGSSYPYTYQLWVCH